MLRLCLKEKPFYQGGLKNAYALFWALMLWVLCSPHKRINEWIYSSVIYNDWDSITPVIKVTTKWLNMLQYYCSFFTEEKESLLVSSVILSVNRFCYLQNLQCLNHYNTTKQILFISQFLKCRTLFAFRQQTFKVMWLLSRHNVEGHPWVNYFLAPTVTNMTL